MEQRVVEDGWMSNNDDRISELPQPILEHILYFLPQKDAVKTCALSKLWRNLWFTRPNIEFRESLFGGKYKNFMCGLEQTLRRYHDQNLSVQKFVLEMCSFENITKHLISLIFNSSSLEELNLQNCNLAKIDMIVYENLRTLSLTRVHIPDQTLEKIISSCPLIGFMAFHVCWGLKSIKANKLHYLKSFEFSPDGRYPGYEPDCSIEIDNPTVETISIVSGSICLHHSVHFSNLRSLKLKKVSLSNDSFGFFSRNCPNLEDLSIVHCYRYNGLCISNGSIKNLVLRRRVGPELKEVIIDAPNIVTFEYEGSVPQSFSCTTSNSREWKSYVCPVFVRSSSSLLIGLHELLKELSQSVISLDLRNAWFHYQSLPLELPHDEPVVVEHLELSKLSWKPARVQSVFFSGLFHICRPRFVGRNWHFCNHKLSQFQCYILMMDRKVKKSSPWQHDLEEVHMEKFDQNRQVWHFVHWRGLSRTALRGRDFGRKIRLVLKWRNGDQA